MTTPLNLNIYPSFMRKKYYVHLFITKKKEMKGINKWTIKWQKSDN